MVTIILPAFSSTLISFVNRAKQFTKALDIPASPPEGLDVYLIAGDALPTPAVVAINQNKGKLTVQEKKLGDGIVLRSSALMDERLGGTWSPTLISPITWRQVLFLFTEHLAMTKDPAFTDNLLFLLHHILNSVWPKTAKF